MPTDHESPDIRELESIGRDYSRHRATRAWMAEALGLCVGAFGVGLFDCVRTFASNGLPAVGLLSSVLLAFAIGAVTTAYRTVSVRSTLSDAKRRSARRRLIAATVLAASPTLLSLVAIALAILGRFGGG